MCPKGIPGNEITSWNALDNGIHLCGLNLTDLSKNFDFLNVSKSKVLPNDLDTTSVKLEFAFLAITC